MHLEENIYWNRQKMHIQLPPNIDRRITIDLLSQVSSIGRTRSPPKKYRGPRSPNNAQAACAHFPVHSGGSSQTDFPGGLAVQIEFRTARTSLGAYVRLLSTHLHGMLWARAPGHLRPTPRESSHSRPNLKSRFSRWLTLGGHGPRSVAAGQRFEVIFLGAGRKPRNEDDRANSKDNGNTKGAAV